MKTNQTEITVKSSKTNRNKMEENELWQKQVHSKGFKIETKGKFLYKVATPSSSITAAAVCF